MYVCVLLLQGTEDALTKTDVVAGTAAAVSPPEAPIAKTAGVGQGRLGLCQFGQRVVASLLSISASASALQLPLYEQCMPHLSQAQAG